MKIRLESFALLISAESNKGSRYPIRVGVIRPVVTPSPQTFEKLLPSPHFLQRPIATVPPDESIQWCTHASEDTTAPISCYPPLICLFQYIEPPCCVNKKSCFRQDFLLMYNPSLSKIYARATAAANTTNAPTISTAHKIPVFFINKVRHYVIWVARIQDVV